MSNSILSQFPEDTKFQHQLKSGKNITVYAEGQVIPGSLEDPSWSVSALKVTPYLPGTLIQIDPRDILAEWNEIEHKAITLLCEKRYQRTG